MNVGRKRGVWFAAVLLAGLIACAYLGLAWGEDGLLSPGEVAAALRGEPGGPAFLVSEFRLPRVVGGLVAGCGLALAGAITQSLLRNPLASPDIIGVTTGAGAAAVASIAMASGALPALVGLRLAPAALVGGLTAGLAVLVLASRGGLAPQRVVLVGLGVNAACGALVSWMLLSADLSSLSSSLVWLTGSLNEVRAEVLPFAASVVAAGALACAFGRRTLGTLQYDLRVAAALGVNVRSAQWLFLLIAVAVAAAVTAIGGPIPFVAFMAPHVAAALRGRREAAPLASALVGAVLVSAADLVAAHAFPVPLPVGVVTSFVGVPFLVWLLFGAAARMGARERGRAAR